MATTANLRDNNFGDTLLKMIRMKMMTNSQITTKDMGDYSEKAGPLFRPGSGLVSFLLMLSLHIPWLPDLRCSIAAKSIWPLFICRLRYPTVAGILPRS